MALKLIVKLWALATVRGLLPVIVPLNNDANGTQWGPVTADISANRCRAFAVAFEGGNRCINQMSIDRVVHPTHGLICTHRRQEAGDDRNRRGLEQRLVVSACPRFVGIAAGPRTVGPYGKSQ